MKKKIIFMLILSFVFTLFSGCTNSNSSSSGSANAPIVSTDDSEGDSSADPTLSEGIPGQIDFGDPTERTEIAGGIYDLNPAIPRTLEERRQALLTQLDLSRCSSIDLTGVPLQKTDQLAAESLPDGSTITESQFYRADDGRLFFFETYNDLLNCLNGRPLDSYDISYVLAINRSYSPHFQLFYDGELPASGNLSDTQIAAIYFLDEMDSGAKERAKEIQEWVRSAPEGAQQLLSYDEAMVHLIQQMGWTGFCRKIDSKGCPYYTNGEFMIIGTNLLLGRSRGDIAFSVLYFQLTLYWPQDGDQVMQGNDLFPIFVYSDGLMSESVEEIRDYLKDEMETRQ